MKCIATETNSLTGFNGFSTFHAGRFLREELQWSGHDVQWLAECMNMEKTSVEALFDQDNMDAELFVQLGKHIGNRFFDRLHVIIFGHEKETKTEVVSQH